MSNIRTYKKEVLGVDVYVLELPNTDYFSYEVRILTGSDIENDFLEKTGKNVFGGLHLLEHMSFKSTRDYTTEELLKLFKEKGNRNATTSQDYINFFFKTTMDNMEFAINAVNNVAFNDLSRVNTKEYVNERKVVLNEINRYNEDKQLIFNLTALPLTIDRPAENNILGTYDIVSEIELETLREFKKMLFEYKPIVIVVLDPTYIHDIDKILELHIGNQINKWKEEVGLNLNGKVLNIDSINPNKIFADIETDQNMLTIAFDVVDNIFVTPLGNNFIRELAGENSLFNLYREKYGITYGTSFYIDRISNHHHARFTVDTKREDAGLSLRLIKEALVKMPELYTDEMHKKVIDNMLLKITMFGLDLKYYTNFIYDLIYEPLDRLSEIDRVEMSKNLPLFIKEKIKTIGRDQVVEYLNKYKDAVENKKYRLITNTKELVEE